MKYLKTTLFLFCFVGVISMATAQTSTDLYQVNPIIATIEGEEIRIDDVINKSIHDLLEQLHSALAVELSKQVVEKLSNKQEIQAVPKSQITKEQIESFYIRSNLQNRGTLEKLSPQIKRYLQQQFLKTHIARQLTIAREKGWYKSYLKSPPEFVATAATNTAVIRAAPNASVMFLEFSDYQCPFCSRVQPVIDNLMKKYKGKVTFAYRHFPLPFHTEADEAANAVECAREQGKFEEMHKMLYDNQRQQFLTDLKSYGKKIGIKNLKQFNQCVESEKYSSLVQNDIKEGSELGISGTPGFMIGMYDAKKKQVKGEILSGALPQSAFEELIEKFLNKK